jgi:predicted ATPase
VLTGGPGAGKTAVIEMLAHTLCPHVAFVQESAALLFSGGFPRRNDSPHRRAVQRAIFHVQLELEGLAELERPALVLCDRGVVDGVAYWPGPETFWDALEVDRSEVLSRYDTVIHLRTPNGRQGYGRQNPLREESEVEAREIDERIVEAWQGHPRRFFIEATEDFPAKAAQAVRLILAELPDCCRLIQERSAPDTPLPEAPEYARSR